MDPTFLIPVGLAYLLGSIPFALLVGRAFGVADIRTLGSGNLGATNVWRQLGPTPAIIVLVADIGKGFLAVLCGRIVAARLGTGAVSLDLTYVLCAAAAVLGHVFPVFAGFRGGKGVATGFGALLVLLPTASAIALGIFVAVVASTRIVSLGSLMAALFMPLYLLVLRFGLKQAVAEAYIWLVIVVALLVMWTHRTNLRRLFSGSERRLSISRRQPPEGSDV